MGQEGRSASWTGYPSELGGGYGRGVVDTDRPGRLVRAVSGGGAVARPGPQGLLAGPESPGPAHRGDPGHTAEAAPALAAGFVGIRSAARCCSPARNALPP